MKIALLLLAHKNKEQIERLVSVMRHENVDIYMHLDKKAAFLPEDIDAPGVVFTKNRFDVGLFEFSMVEAEMELIRTAQRRGKYSYYILLSAQCYPLMRVSQIHDLLQSRYPEPFIDVDAPTDDNYVKVIFQHVYILKRFKIKAYDFLRAHFSQKTFQILRYIPGGFALVISRIKELFVQSPRTRLDRKGIVGHCGSQWWILPDNVIDQAVECFEDRSFRNIIDDSFSCDESYFQTVIMRNPEQNGVHTDQRGDYKMGQWFFIFQNGHPIILTKDHYAQITGSGKLFARKFDITVDRDILDLLDASME